MIPAQIPIQSPKFLLRCEQTSTRQVMEHMVLIKGDRMVQISQRVELVLGPRTPARNSYTAAQRTGDVVLIKFGSEVRTFPRLDLVIVCAWRPTFRQITLYTKFSKNISHLRGRMCAATMVFKSTMPFRASLRTFSANLGGRDLFFT